MAIHSAFDKKLALRRELPKTGMIFMPFCGRGDLLAASQINPRRVVACDIHSERVKDFKTRFPEARVRHTDAATFDFDNEGYVYSVIDIDAFHSPYKALEHFLLHAETTENVVCILTDGTRQKRLRKRMVYDFRAHKYAMGGVSGAAHQDAYWDDHVEAFLASLGWGIKKCKKETYKWILYCRLELAWGWDNRI